MENYGVFTVICVMSLSIAAGAVAYFKFESPEQKRVDSYKSCVSGLMYSTKDVNLAVSSCKELVHEQTK